MAQYIGKAPINGFHAKQTLTGDGSTTAFTLDQTTASETALIVSVGGVIQEPKVAYNLTIGGTKIDFTEAPSSTDTVYVQFLGTAVVTNLNDINGTEFVLDVDGDTSFTADTDDEVDIRVGGADISTIKATGFHNLDNIKFVAGTGDDMQMYHDGTNSFLTNSEGALKIATETSGIAVTIGHTTSEVTIADNATVTGNLTVTGTLTQTGAQTFDGGLTVDNFNLNGTTLALSSGDMLIDVAGDITLDADGADINFADAGTTFGTITNSSSDFVIFSAVSDKDILIKGNDGGSTITALTLDMSAAGAATFNSTVQATGLNIGGTAITSTAAEINIIDGGTSATSTTVADADRVVMNDNGTMVQVAVTDLAAYFDDEITAMPNLTSVGTLTALTVDDVVVNGKVITMTGSSSDTAVFTAGTDGTLSIVTTDAGGAAANIQITADGTAELAGTTVTLDSSGGITLDADGGTITFADAGSSLGTITSSGYSGTSAAATTVTITDNESTNENNVIVFVAGADSDGGTGLGLESDGNLTYNPSTGTLSVTNISVSGTQTIVDSVTMNASNAVVFEGATADAHETTLTTIDATGDRTISLPNVAGTLPVLAAVSATAITSTPEEINLIDGGTSRGTTAVASGDGILINDGGTMRMTNVDTVSTYFASHTVGGGNIVTTGALDSGSITSGFGAIDNGTSNIRSATITAETAFVPDASDGAALGTSSLEFSDLFLADGAVISLGDDDDVTLTHVADTGILLNGNNVIQFNDASQNIGATSGTILDINATDEIELNATAIDINGTCDVSGAFTTGSTIVSTGKITADAGIDIDNFNIDGTTIALSSGNMILDSAADIFLDAGGADIVFKDDGTQIGLFTMDSSNLTLQGSVSDKDLIFKGNDGGSTITALTLDMSAAGAATFNNDVTAFSDARLKDNVETIPNALETVCAMRGVNFTRNDNNDQPGTGVIAQEMQEVFPVVVKENDDENNTLSVSYGNLVGVLIESIKELKAEIDELKGN
jgi:hypothetical protein